MGLKCAYSCLSNDFFIAISGFPSQNSLFGPVLGYMKSKKHGKLVFGQQYIVNIGPSNGFWCNFDPLPDKRVYWDLFHMLSFDCSQPVPICVVFQLVVLSFSK